MTNVGGDPLDWRAAWYALDADNRALAAKLAEVKAERDRLEQRYQREVLGLNNEGDPIGGNPPTGLKARADDAEADLTAARAALVKAQKSLDFADYLYRTVDGWLKHGNTSHHSIQCALNAYQKNRALAAQTQDKTDE